MRAGLILSALCVLLGLSPAWAQEAPAAAPSAAPAASAGALAAPPKVLRYAIRIAESGFDPQRVTDLYSRTITAAIFDAPLRYDYLARPHRLRPGVTEGMPEISADYKTQTFRIRPGIYFADDPAFKGHKRELTAGDFVYALKRHYDPAVKSGNLYLLENAQLPGLSELRREALRGKKPFDYDRPVAGVRQLDRYRFQVRTERGDPRFVHRFADASMAAVAREVVEAYGEAVMEHPVGTGAWRLTQWRRSSLMVLEKNPNFRDEFYNEEPDPSDARLVAQAAQLQGRKLPLIDRVEISVIEEAQPRWLSFLRHEADFVDELPQDFAPMVMPHGHLAPNLAKEGLQAYRYVRADVALSYFNMDDPVVGGYTPEKVALRRAMSLAVDVDKEIRIVRRGQAIAAQGPIAPGTFGYEPGFKSTLSEFSLARARALLDVYGYVDRDGDGWREQPDGSPLTIEYTTEPDGERRQLAEQWQIAMNALGIRMKFRIGKWPENLKAANAARLQMWGVGWSASTPDGNNFLDLGYGGNKGQANKSRFDLPAFNALYERLNALPDGPERQALMHEAQRLMVAYMPYKIHVHRIYTDLAQPWVIGYTRNIYMRDFWTFIDIDSARQQAALR